MICKQNIWCKAHYSPVNCPSLTHGAAIYVLHIKHYIA